MLTMFSPLVDNILSNFNINNVNSLVDGSYLNNMLNVKNDTNENDVEIVWNNLTFKKKPVYAGFFYFNIEN